MTRKFKLAKGWPKSRWRELYDLRSLLFAVAALNDGSNHLEKTAQCIKEAKRLIQTNRGTRLRIDFIEFLKSLAIVEIPEPAAK